MSTQQPTAQQEEALTRAKTNLAFSNYPAIFQGFIEKGIPEAEIEPRVNVFTYHAWKALGYQVRKGEHGVSITTWITCRARKDKQAADKSDSYRRPKQTTVFHVSQTEVIHA
jgi:hypothetical protein